jgi:hypothetical protein
MFPVSHICALGRPELDLDDRNFMALCESENGDVAQNHHLLIGHLADWKSMNENMVKDAQKFVSKTAVQIKADSHWKTEEASKPKHASQLTASDNAHLLGLIEAKFGKRKP